MRQTTRLALLVALALPSGAIAQEAPKLIDYTVKKGETCSSIAQRFYGDSARVDIIHEHNSLGDKLPHSLKAGMKLKLLPKSAVASGAPDARLTFVRNSVEAYTPDQHPGQRNEPLLRGHRVSTLASSTAEVTFKDQSILQMGEHTLVVVLGDMSSQVRKRATASDTTLMNGSLRAHLSDLVGETKRKPLAMSTAGGQKVTLGPGEAAVRVDEKKNARLAVYKGLSRLRTIGGEVAVKAGFVSEAAPGKKPTPPKPLPAAPRWVSPPPHLLLSAGAPVDASGTFAPGAETPKPVAWHVQLAREARFNDLIVDADVPVELTTLSARQIPPGEYFARVAAVDADGNLGHFSAPARVLVALARVVPGQPGRRASLALTEGLNCTLDGSQLATSATSADLAPGQTHVLRCALPGDEESARELTIPAKDCGPLLVRHHLDDVKLSSAEGAARLVVEPSDAVGKPIMAKVEAAPTPGVTVAPFATEAAAQVAALRWQPTAKGLDITVGGIERATVALPPLPPPPAPPPPPPTKTDVAIEAAIMGNIQYVLGDVGLAGGFSAEVGTGIEHGLARFGIALRLGYDYFPVGNAPCSKDGTTCTAEQNANGYNFVVAHHTLPVSLPISFRFRGMDKTLVPYLGVAPGVILEWLSTHYPPVPDKDTSTFQAQFSVAGFLGLQINVFHGGVFIEAAYRWSPGTDSASAGSVLSVGGLNGVVGYRLHL